MIHTTERNIFRGKCETNCFRGIFENTSTFKIKLVFFKEKSHLPEQFFYKSRQLPIVKSTLIHNIDRFAGIERNMCCPG